MGKALLISEHNGHMFPTKSYDTWERRQEHALRHARVQNAAAADGVHAGCFGWCMFDYPTHKDFGSGDRVCYHGVMDAFRNPKLAAALYASQGEETPVLEVGNPMDIGDYPGGNVGEIYVFTNADEVELYKNDHFVASFRPPAGRAAPRPDADRRHHRRLLETQEGFDPAKAGLQRRCLLAAGKYGLANMPPRTKCACSGCMARYGMSYADGMDLYGKYVGNWGGEATRWRFDAKNGQVVACRTRCPADAAPGGAPSQTVLLHEGDTYDMAAVRIRVLDENGNLPPMPSSPCSSSPGAPRSWSGPRSSPPRAACAAAMCAPWAGRARQLTVSAEGLEPVTLEFHHRKEGRSTMAD